MTDALVLASFGGDAIRLLVSFVGFGVILAFWYLMISRLGSF